MRGLIRGLTVLSIYQKAHPLSVRFWNPHETGQNPCLRANLPFILLKPDSFLIHSANFTLRTLAFFSDRHSSFFMKNGRLNSKSLFRPLCRQELQSSRTASRYRPAKSVVTELIKVIDTYRLLHRSLGMKILGAME